jgi:hypothetical protein
VTCDLTALRAARPDPVSGLGLWAWGLIGIRPVGGFVCVPGLVRSPSTRALRLGPTALSEPFLWRLLWSGRRHVRRSATLPPPSGTLRVPSFRRRQLRLPPEVVSVGVRWRSSPIVERWTFVVGALLRRVAFCELPCAAQWEPITLRVPPLFRGAASDPSDPGLFAGYQP